MTFKDLSVAYPSLLSLPDPLPELHNEENFDYMQTIVCIQQKHHNVHNCNNQRAFWLAKILLNFWSLETMISQSPVDTSTGHTRNIEISTPKCNSYLHTVIGIWCHIGMETLYFTFRNAKIKSRKEEQLDMSNVSTSFKMNPSISWNLLIYISSRFIEITFPSVSSKMKKK